MTDTRRGFLKKLGLGTAALGAATVLPMPVEGKQGGGRIGKRLVGSGSLPSPGEVPPVHHPRATIEAWPEGADRRIDRPHTKSNAGQPGGPHTHARPHGRTALGLDEQAQARVREHKLSDRFWLFWAETAGTPYGSNVLKGGVYDAKLHNTLLIGVGATLHIMRACNVR